MRKTLYEHLVCISEANSRLAESVSGKLMTLLPEKEVFKGKLIVRDWLRAIPAIEDLSMTVPLGERGMRLLTCASLVDDVIHLINVNDLNVSDGTLKCLHTVRNNNRVIGRSILEFIRMNPQFVNISPKKVVTVKEILL